MTGEPVEINSEYPNEPESELWRLAYLSCGGDVAVGQRIRQVYPHIAPSLLLSELARLCADEYPSIYEEAVEYVVEGELAR